MKKTFKMLSKILMLLIFIPVELILLLFNASIWIRVPPPASAVLTLPKILYPNIVHIAVFVYIALIAILVAVLVINHYKSYVRSALAKSVMLISLVTLTLCLASGLVYMNIIKNTNVDYAISHADPVSNNEDVQLNLDNRFCVDLAQNFTEQTPATFKLYMPDDSKTPRDVVMYLAYGNWLAVSEDNITYLVDNLNQNGYGTIVFTGKTRLETDFSGMVRDILEKIAYLKSVSVQYGIRHIYLSGGSAGANLALIAAYAYDCDAYRVEGLPVEETKADGVIAFYPVVDMLYNYDYFTNKTDQEKNVFDKLGDAIFSMQDVNKAKTIDESTRIVMKFLFGGSPYDGDLMHLYEISSPNRFISKDAPPTLFIQGSHDSMNPIEPTRTMYENLKKLGTDVTMLELPFTDHAFDMVMPDGSVVTAKVLESIDEWLDNHKS